MSHRRKQAHDEHRTIFCQNDPIMIWCTKNARQICLRAKKWDTPVIHGDVPYFAPPCDIHRRRLDVVGLSGLHSNNYKRLLSHRKQILSGVSNNDDAVSKTERPAKRVNEHGETEVGRVISAQKRLTDAEKREIASAYNTGKTTYQLAEQYGCCRRAIVNALKKSGITATKAKAQKALNTHDVIKMYGEFHTTAAIAKKYGVGPNSVIKCLRSNGVAIRSRWDYPRK